MHPPRGLAPAGSLLSVRFTKCCAHGTFPPPCPSSHFLLTHRTCICLTLKWSLGISSFLVCPPHGNICSSSILFPAEPQLIPEATKIHTKGVTVRIPPSGLSVAWWCRWVLGRGQEHHPGEGHRGRQRQPGSETGEHQARPQQEEWGNKKPSSQWTDGRSRARATRPRGLGCSQMSRHSAHAGPAPSTYTAGRPALTLPESLSKLLLSKHVRVASPGSR